MIKSAYLHSSSSDRYKDIFFKIIFYSRPEGWTTDLEIDGRPPVESRIEPSLSRDEAKANAETVVRQMIDQGLASSVSS